MVEEGWGGLLKSTGRPSQIEREREREREGRRGRESRERGREEAAEGREGRCVGQPEPD